MDKPTEAAIRLDPPHLPCSLCERECMHDGLQLVLGNVVIQVTCHECAARFRAIVKLSLAAARQLRRRDHELDAEDDESDEETIG